MDRSLNVVERRPAIVALTGGIGSGKSTVAHGLTCHGISVQSADAVVHRLYAHSSPVIAMMIGLFGKAILNEHGVIDRPRLRSLTLALPQERPATIAQKDANRERLMKALFPFVWDGLMDHLKEHAHESCVVWEIPLFFEADWEQRVDWVVVVDCPETVQRERVALRNGWGDDLIDAMMARQVSRAIRLNGAHEVVNSDVAPDVLDTNILKLAERLKTRYPDPPNHELLEV